MNDNFEDAITLSNAANLVDSLNATERQILVAQAQVEATLALAYEQRTANLIAAFTQGGEQPPEVFEIAIRDHDSEAAKVIDKWQAVGKQIEERLGLA